MGASLRHATATIFHKSPRFGLGRRGYRDVLHPWHSLSHIGMIRTSPLRISSIGAKSTRQLVASSSTVCICIAGPPGLLLEKIERLAQFHTSHIHTQKRTFLCNNAYLHFANKLDTEESQHSIMCSTQGLATSSALKEDHQATNFWTTLHHTSPSTTGATFSFPTPLESRDTMPLIFAPAPSQARALKRGRALADIDGEFSSPQKKKRRLRLFLITSRLSPEFSSPATNIADRGTNRIAVWAKQKGMGRIMLRKAVILNSMRLRTKHMLETKELGEKLERLIRERAHVEEEGEKRKCEMRLLGMVGLYGRFDGSARPLLFEKLSFLPPTPMSDAHQRSETTPILEDRFLPLKPLLATRENDDGDSAHAEYQSPNDAYASISTPKSPKSRKVARDHVPEHPSPLGLSNYDAFDLDEDFPDPYSHFDEDHNVGIPTFERRNGHGGAKEALETLLFGLPGYDNTGNKQAAGHQAALHLNYHVSKGRGFVPCIGNTTENDEAVWSSVVGPSALLHMGSSATSRESCSPNIPTLFTIEGQSSKRGRMRPGDDSIIRSA